MVREFNVKCPKCGREDVLAVGRKRTIVEYRVLNTKNKVAGGHYPYKGNWKQESAKIDGKEFIRCNACENKIDVSEIEGVGEVKIDKTKGALFVNDFLDKFLEKDEEELKTNIK